jgi:hypothetical protein
MSDSESGDDEKTEFMNDTLNSDEEGKEPLLAIYKSSLTSSPSSSPEQSESESESESETPDAQPPQVSPLKRTSLLIFFAILCWLAYSNVLHTKRKPNIIHASRSVLISWNLFLTLADNNKKLHRKKRYSKDYKFRPAASPVITETLKDGRMRLRGALPEPTQQPVLPPTAKKMRRPKAGKASGKRKSKSKPRTVNQQRM